MLEPFTMEYASSKQIRRRKMLMQFNLIAMQRRKQREVTLVQGAPFPPQKKTLVQGALLLL